MTLRTVPVPDPPPGEDWQTVVPGQYLYAITGITATLTTLGAPSVMVDATGNGNDGFYTSATPPYPQPVAGLVVGDDAMQFNDLTATSEASHASIPATPVDWAQPWSVEFWIEVDGITDAPAGGVYGLDGGGNTGAAVTVFNTGDVVISAFTGAGLEAQPYAVGTVPLGAGHYVVATWDGTNYLLTVDTVSQTPTATIVGGAPLTTTAPVGIATFPPGGGTSASIMDELAFYPTVLGAGSQSVHFGLQADFAAYSTAVLSDGPAAYYHLDDVGEGDGRQVALEITNGQLLLELIPTGFPDLTSTGPFAYSWQPNLNSSTQTPNTALTTIAIPQLILPAGYTVGTDTLDIAAGDQWSNITVWWDDSIMDSLSPIDLYAYPPGALLVYQQVKANP